MTEIEITGIFGPIIPDEPKRTMRYLPYGQHWWAPYYEAAGGFTRWLTGEAQDGNMELNVTFRADERGWRYVPSPWPGANIVEALAKAWGWIQAQLREKAA